MHWKTEQAKKLKRLAEEQVVIYGTIPKQKKPENNAVFTVYTSAANQEGLCKAHFNFPPEEVSLGTYSGYGPLRYELLDWQEESVQRTLHDIFFMTEPKAYLVHLKDTTVSFAEYDVASDNELMMDYMLRMMEAIRYEFASADAEARIELERIYKRLQSKRTDAKQAAYDRARNPLR